MNNCSFTGYVSFRFIFIRGYITSKLYLIQPSTILKLRDRITETCASISPETFQNFVNVEAGHYDPFTVVTILPSIDFLI